MKPGTAVLHVLDHSLPLLSGYSTRSHHLLRAQHRWGLQPLAVTSPKHGSAAGREQIDGITYVRTPATASGVADRVPAWGELRLMWRLASCVTQVAVGAGSHVLHAHSPVLNGFPALWAGRRLGVPVVYEVRAFWEDAAVDHGTHGEGSARYRVIRALETFVMRRADAVGVISRGLAVEVQRRGISAHKIFQSPNGVDTAIFHPVARAPELTTRWNLAGQTVIGFIGSFYRYEGLDVLVKAWARIAGDLPNAVVLLVGGGEMAAALQAQARRLGVDSRIIFAGSVPHSEVIRCYSVCDVLVYPRKSMRLTELVTPLKPLEAMAMGKAVVASDVGGLRELISDRSTGVLFPADDAEALAEVLREVVRRADLRAALGEQALATVRREREWTQLVRVHVQSYARLINGTQHAVA
jgi:PEP-CTERM/exosortase A-associated glycosyltransferase